MALILTAVSGIEVNIPSTKNEIANEEILNFLDIVSTDLIINPAPAQIAANAIK
jgi:hypothetical protein